VNATTAYTLLIVLVSLERVTELVVSQRNLRWSRERGGQEYGRGHYPFMVVLHVGLLAGALVEIHRPGHTFEAALVVPMLVLVAASQGLRWWCIASLGPRWNTRVVIVPGLPRVTSGPYRWLRHPNYVAVVVEGFALPLVGSAWVTALVFSALNAPLMAVRIRTEDAALDLLPAASAESTGSTEAAGSTGEAGETAPAGAP